jgi:hypothetical protein
LGADLLVGGDLLNRALKSCCGVGPSGAWTAGALAVSASESAEALAFSRALASSGALVAASGARVAGNVYLLADKSD